MSEYNNVRQQLGWRGGKCSPRIQLHTTSSREVTGTREVSIQTIKGYLETLVHAVDLHMSNSVYCANYPWPDREPPCVLA